MKNYTLKMKNILARFKARLKSLISDFLSLHKFINREELENVLNTNHDLKEKLAEFNEKLTPQVIKKFQDPNLYEFEKKDLKIRVRKWNALDKDECTFSLNKPVWTKGAAEVQSVSPFSSIMEFSNSYDNKGRQHTASWDKEYYLKSKDGSEIIKFIDSFTALPVAKIRSMNSYEFSIYKSAAVSWDELMKPLLNIIVSLFPDVEIKDENLQETENVTEVANIEDKD